MIPGVPIGGVSMLRLLRDLVLAVGDAPGCAKLAVPCSCGKAAQLREAHAQAARFLRDVRELP